MMLAATDPTSWSSRPLCRRYVLCIPSTVIVRWREADVPREREVHWMLGWLADGECEPLGAWMGPIAFRQMRDDLKSRGVRCIWHVALLSGAMAESQGALCSVEIVFPGAMTSSVPAVWPAASATAEDVRQTLDRAVRRHGHFENAAAALDFVLSMLMRAERRLDKTRQLAQKSLLAGIDIQMTASASGDATTARASGRQR